MILIAVWSDARIWTDTEGGIFDADVVWVNYDLVVHAGSGAQKCRLRSPPQGGKQVSIAP
jgi:hypothetical protein